MPPMSPFEHKVLFIFVDHFKTVVENFKMTFMGSNRGAVLSNSWFQYKGKDQLKKWQKFKFKKEHVKTGVCPPEKDDAQVYASSRKPL